MVSENLSYNHYDEIMDFYDIKFNFEKNILEEITIKLYEILRNYINANIVSEKEILKKFFKIRIDIVILMVFCV